MDWFWLCFQVSPFLGPSLSSSLSQRCAFLIQKQTAMVKPWEGPWTATKRHHPPLLLSFFWSKQRTQPSVNSAEKEVWSSKQRERQTIRDKNIINYRNFFFYVKIEKKIAVILESKGLWLLTYPINVKSGLMCLSLQIDFIRSKESGITCLSSTAVLQTLT